MTLKKSVYSVGVCLALSGCGVSPEFYAQNFQNLGSITVNELPKSCAKLEGYDLKIQMPSIYDFGLNTNQASDRLKMVGLLRPDCINPLILGEFVVEAETVTGVVSNRYYMDIKCSGERYSN